MFHSSFYYYTCTYRISALLPFNINIILLLHRCECGYLDCLMGRQERELDREVFELPNSSTSPTYR